MRINQSQVWSILQQLLRHLWLTRRSQDNRWMSSHPQTRKPQVLNNNVPNSISHIYIWEWSSIESTFCLFPEVTSPTVLLTSTPVHEPTSLSFAAHPYSLCFTPASSDLVDEGFAHVLQSTKMPYDALFDLTLPQTTALFIKRKTKVNEEESVEKRFSFSILNGWLYQQEVCVLIAAGDYGERSHGAGTGREEHGWGVLDLSSGGFGSADCPWTRCTWRSQEVRTPAVTVHLLRQTSVTSFVPNPIQCYLHGVCSSPGSLWTDFWTSNQRWSPNSVS